MNFGNDQGRHPKCKNWVHLTFRVRLCPRYGYILEYEIKIPQPLNDHTKSQKIHTSREYKSAYRLSSPSRASSPTKKSSGFSSSVETIHHPSPNTRRARCRSTCSRPLCPFLQIAHISSMLPPPTVKTMASLKALPSHSKACACSGTETTQASRHVL